MSQFVWTCRCGWRTTAENSSLGHRGDPPPHCRRCHRNTFTVTTEKHPKVTHVCKNPECREDFIGHVGAKHCDKCRGKIRTQKIWDGRRKYIWTPERDQTLRDEYKHNATELANRFGWPKWVVVKRASQLGLCRVKEKPWTKAEDAFLLEHVGARTAFWMARQLRTRTETAVVVRLKRLHISRRIQVDGLTMGQLEQALGTDHRRIKAWWLSGRLTGVRRDTDRLPQQGGDPYVFRDADVASFLLQNPTAFRLDRVDQAWFMGLMREAVGASSSHTRERSKATTNAGASRKVAAPKRIPVAVPPPESVTACIGVDETTPCPHHKDVIAQRHIPPRCPDCRLELRRRLQREDMDRMRRIRATAAPRAVSA